jgi:hypothetical protein
LCSVDAAAFSIPPHRPDFPCLKVFQCTSTVRLPKFDPARPASQPVQPGDPGSRLQQRHGRWSNQWFLRSGFRRLLRRFQLDWKTFLTRLRSTGEPSSGGQVSTSANRSGRLRGLPVRGLVLSWMEHSMPLTGPDRPLATQKRGISDPGLHQPMLVLTDVARGIGSPRLSRRDLHHATSPADGASS